MLFLINCMLLSKVICVIDYARKYNELFIKSSVVESEWMTITHFKSGLRSVIKEQMSRAYLEDLEDVIETAMQFEFS